jgi:hypothetical protein
MFHIRHSHGPQDDRKDKFGQLTDTWRRASTRPLCGVVRSKRACVYFGLVFGYRARSPCQFSGSFPFHRAAYPPAAVAESLALLTLEDEHDRAVPLRFNADKHGAIRRKIVAFDCNGAGLRSRHLQDIVIPSGLAFEIFAGVNRGVVLSISNILVEASSEKSVGHRYAPMGAGNSVRAAREPDVG